MLAQERKKLILEQLQQDKKVIVSDLSKMYDVSEETIRRDLDKLEKEGYAHKSYGGATLKESANMDLPFSVRKKRNTTAKQKIADLILPLVEEGDYIMLDASSTAVFVMKAIKHIKNITLITNSLEVLLEARDTVGWNVISPGGALNTEYLAFVGPQMEAAFSAYRVNKVIFSCKGLDMERGLSDGYDGFVQAKTAMINCATQRILTVDSSKFDRKAFIKFSDFTDIHMVVTDKQPSDEWLEFFKDNNICCIYE